MLKVGSLVIGQHFKNALHRNGQEGVIIAGEKLRTSADSTTGRVSTNLNFKVRWSDGVRSNVSRFNLRPKRPPSNEQKIMDMFKNPVQELA